MVAGVCRSLSGDPLGPQPTSTRAAVFMCGLHCFQLFPTMNSASNASLYTGCSVPMSDQCSRGTQRRLGQGFVLLIYKLLFELLPSPCVRRRGFPPSHILVFCLPHYATSKATLYNPWEIWGNRKEQLTDGLVRRL